MNSISKFQIVLLSALLLFFVDCSSRNKQDTPKPEDKPAEKTDDKKDQAKTREIGDEGTTEGQDPEPVGTIDKLKFANDAMIQELNEKLRDVRYPDGNTIEGFEYKKWEIPNRKDFEKWVKVSGSLIKDALSKLPENINLEITGHADATGPEEKEGSKLGNIFYSQKRAESVKNSLVKLGFPEDRMLTKGAGSSMPIPDVEAESPKNRRVTFKLVNSGTEIDDPIDTDDTK
ncbi:MAG: OmpA family protein [Leptospiraceae bacterium]|nr:OmpA family protein [Leptospiraceae bacterium]MCP5512967.1 OmpA family protein [Leptospiraceae bacterium]